MDRVVVVGPPGSGKTTTAAAIANADFWAAIGRTVYFAGFTLVGSTVFGLAMALMIWCSRLRLVALRDSAGSIRTTRRVAAGPEVQAKVIEIVWAKHLLVGYTDDPLPAITGTALWLALLWIGVALTQRRDAR